MPANDPLCYGCRQPLADSPSNLVALCDACTGSHGARGFRAVDPPPDAPAQVVQPTLRYIYRCGEVEIELWGRTPEDMHALKAEFLPFYEEIEGEEEGEDVED